MKFLNGGRSAPWVRAASRATRFQKPSTNFGVTRTAITGGRSAKYSDHSPNSVSRPIRASASGDRPLRPPVRSLSLACWITRGVMMAMSKSCDDNTGGVIGLAARAVSPAALLRDGSTGSATSSGGVPDNRAA